MTLRSLFLFAFSMFAFSAQARPAAVDAVGVWLNDGGTQRMRLAPCGIALCGTLVWMQDPRKDIYNPDEKEREKNLVGRRILSGFVVDGVPARWKGSAYDPDDGRTYTGIMTQTGDSLTVQGCVSNGVICSTMSWTKVN